MTRIHGTFLLDRGEITQQKFCRFGFADLVLIPRKNVISPAIVIELKYNRDADTAIFQIKRQQYPDKVAHYADNLLLVGINYDRDSKQHECHIEQYVASE